MPNPHKGEATLTVGEKVYTLRLGFDCLARIEEETNKPIDQVFRELQDDKRPRLKLMRLVFWAALQEFHPGLTLLEAGELITSAGLGEVFTAFSDASRRGFPGAAAGAGEGDGAIPQTADDGTGQDSSAKQSSQG